MNNEENTQGNPETVDESVFGSNSDDFFAALESDVNSMVSEDSKETSNVENEATSTQSPEVKTPKTQVSQGSEDPELDNLKKRYSDSSREAQNLRAQLNELKPFVPVLDAMKKDNGLVSHVRDYFDNGGKLSDNLKEQLKLDEDFSFDADEMVSNPDSDSRKVFDTMVDKIVNKRANQIVGNLKQESQEEEYNSYMANQARDFAARRNLTKDEMQNFVNEANHKMKTEGMTFDDMWLIVNKGTAAQNVANSTKQDMLNQMKNVRDIPTSQSASNNAGKPNNVNDSVFDALLNSDGNIEELLG